MRAWFRTGTPWIWLNAGAIALSLVMVLGVLGLITVHGASHFWPADLEQIQLRQTDGTETTLLAEVVRTEEVSAAVLKDSGVAMDKVAAVYQRHLLKLGNRDVYGVDFRWYLDQQLSSYSKPANATVIERREWGNFYGFPQQLLEADKVVAEGEALWPELVKRIARANAIFDQISDIEKGGINRRKPDGSFELIAQGPSSILVWPDASRLGPDGFLYFPSSQINRFAGNSPTGKLQIQYPFHMFKVKLPVSSLTN